MAGTEENVPSGPGYLCVTNLDGTTAAGADWTAIKVQSCTINPNPQMAWTSDAFSGAKRSTGIIFLPSEATMNLSISDAGIVTLNQLLMGSTLATDAGPPIRDTLGFHDQVTFADGEDAGDLFQVAFIPLAEAGDGEDAHNGVWFPRCYFDNLSDLVYQRVESGQDTHNPYTLVCNAIIDARAVGPVDSGFRCGMIGPIFNAGTVMEGIILPTLAADAI